MWLASIRNGSKPHLVPLWFVFHKSKFYMSTLENTVKVRNIRKNPKVTVSLDDANKVLTFDCEGKIISRPFPLDVLSAFKTKFDWKIDENVDNRVLIEIVPYHKIAFNV